MSDLSREEYVKRLATHELRELSLVLLKQLEEDQMIRVDIDQGAHWIACGEQVIQSAYWEQYADENDDLE